MTTETIGFNHVATYTPDLDRYVAFYSEVFGAEVMSVSEAHGTHPRMAVVSVGGVGALNVFEVPAETIIGERTTMGGRGPIDHFALAVDSLERLEAVRDRLVARGASPGVITEFSTIFSVFFRDPDGAELEVVVAKARS